ncbi:Putative cyclase [Amycolatopsis marina]|uniref:Cyclase n=1 Tax=Amycolatopsis marina TaxID=490629 RepID=A0A1I1ARK5_9PSEU|nr:cyclase family protein [Amycolatopsis marina]SFB40699.1 Putative cyclase [Amycolatopsis marina]
MQTWKHNLTPGAKAGDVDGQSSPSGRRAFLKAGATAAVGLALPPLITGAAATAAPRPIGGQQEPFRGPIDDQPISLEFAQRRWNELGIGDERGALREITPEKTTNALRMLHKGTAHVYDLGDKMFPGVPAFPSAPPRRWDMYITWYDLGGENRLTGLEERFAAMTFQVGTQIDNLNHIGIDDHYYGGFTRDDLLPMPELVDPASRAAKATQDSQADHHGPGSILRGCPHLGAEHIGPIVTRGVLVDVLAYMQCHGRHEALSEGRDTLAPNYRITIQDIEATLGWEGISRLDPGDVVIFRTGWNKLWADSALWSRYLSSEPGIWLAEARWLAQFRPAIVGGDTWGLEVFPSPVPTRFGEPHQLLLAQEGIRIGEGYVTDGLSEAGKYEFVFIDTPQHAVGATATHNGPAAIATS